MSNNALEADREAWWAASGRGIGIVAGRSTRSLARNVMAIDSSITEIIGRWVAVGGVVKGDDACRRIEHILAEGRLAKIAVASDGWATLYKDPSDGRLWELSYPESHMHGGGPPKLSVISQVQASTRYGKDVAG